jgi:hypothetical protein
MKANNETAVAFQGKVADEVLPSIREHGAYMTSQVIEKALTDPDTIIRLAIDLKKERLERLLLENQRMVMLPKVFYYDQKDSIRLIGIDSPESRKNKEAYKDAERSGKDIWAITSMRKETTKYAKGLIRHGDEINNGI